MRHVLLAATTLAGCIAVAVVLPLVSAPVTAQEQAATPASQDPTVDCVKALPSDDRFAAIRGKLPLAGADISLTMMANDALPTKQEREAIASWFDARDACAKLGESWREQYYPAEIVALTNAAATKVKVIGVDLYQGKISYGEANKRIATFRDDFVAQLTVIVQRLKRELAAQQEAETERQDQLAAQREQQEQQNELAAEQQREQRRQMILNYLATRPPVQLPTPPPLNPGVTTNCIRNGNSVSCYTR